MSPSLLAQGREGSLPILIAFGQEIDAHGLGLLLNGEGLARGAERVNTVVDKKPIVNHNGDVNQFRLINWQGSKWIVFY